MKLLMLVLNKLKTALKLLCCKIWHRKTKDIGIKPDKTTIVETTEKENFSMKNDVLVLAGDKINELQTIEYFRKDGQRWFSQQSLCQVTSTNYFPGCNVGRVIVIAKNHKKYFRYNKRSFQRRVFISEKDLVQYIKDRNEISLDRKREKMGNVGGWSEVAAKYIFDTFGIKVVVSSRATAMTKKAPEGTEERRAQEKCIGDINARKAYVKNRRAQAAIRTALFNVSTQEDLLYTVFGEKIRKEYASAGNRNRSRKTK